MERLVTDWTFVRFLTAVRQFVILIVALLMETWISRKTEKMRRGNLKLGVNENDLRFFFRTTKRTKWTINFLFILIFFGIRKSTLTFATIFTFVRLITVVNSNMCVESWWTIECFSASLTLVWFVGCVNNPTKRENEE